MIKLTHESIGQVFKDSEGDKYTFVGIHEKDGDYVFFNHDADCYEPAMFESAFVEELQPYTPKRPTKEVMADMVVMIEELEDCMSDSADVGGIDALLKEVEWLEL